MKQKEVIEFWLKSAKEDLKTAESLLKLKRYHHCLFFCHLFLEKTLKAIVVKVTDQAPPWTHDLLRLAETAEISLSVPLKKDLKEINSFNIRARYNDVKFKFYKRATKAYTEKYYRRSREIYQWLKEQI